MMQATVGAVERRGGWPGVEPVVLVEGVPEPGLRVSALSMTGPMDVREAWLTVVADEAGARVGGRAATIGLGQRLVDGSVRWVVLAEGELAVAERREAAGEHAVQWMLRDAWTRRLASGAEAIWWADGDGALRRERAGVLEPGGEGNRSGQRYRVGASDVHVLSREGEAWTLGAALASVSALGELELDLTLLPPWEQEEMLGVEGVTNRCI